MRLVLFSEGYKMTQIYFKGKSADKIKLCIHCKHLDGDLCMNKKSFNKIDLVTGELAQEYKYASTQRIGFWLSDLFATDSCGQRGKWYEPK